MQNTANRTLHPIPTAERTEGKIHCIKQKADAKTWIANWKMCNALLPYNVRTFVRWWCLWIFHFIHGNYGTFFKFILFCIIFIFFFILLFIRLFVCSFISLRIHMLYAALAGSLSWGVWIVDEASVGMRRCWLHECGREWQHEVSKHFSLTIKSTFCIRVPFN